MLVPASGGEQVWGAQGFRARFRLGHAGDPHGFGYGEEQAAAVVVNDSQLPVTYLVGMPELGR